jgi:hypothetical protein
MKLADPPHALNISIKDVHYTITYKDANSVMISKHRTQRARPMTRAADQHSRASYNVSESPMPNLDPIIWNFKVLTMEFTVASQSFLLQGLIAPFLWEESDLWWDQKGRVLKGCFCIYLLDNVEESVR